MSNKRVNKAYVRYDGSGRVIPGSLILNRFKPKVGNWSETPAYECCNVGVTLTDTIPDPFPLNAVSIRMFCDETTISTEYTSGTVINMTELIDLLNSDAGTASFGTYSAINPTTVQLVVPLSVKNTLCPNGVLTFNIFED